jgi:tRNA A-37 threonylcarbamoyl transferase component Bud32
MVTDPEGADSESDEDLLQQWEQRIESAGDPIGALAALLGDRRILREELFGKVGTTVLGCRLDRILGAGGMGVTYSGVDAEGQSVAVKLVPGVDGSTRERFEQECRVLRTLDHAAIVRYRAHCVLPDRTGVLVMDRIDGTDLEGLLAALGTLDPLSSGLPVVADLLREVDARDGDLWLSPRFRRRMMRMLAEIAEGLHSAHCQGVIHRDVKPANILVQADLSPVLIDFGLARDVTNRVSFTQSGAAMGTLAYMAPEQLGRDPGAVDARTDVYALGLILYRVLTGTDLRQQVGEVVKGSHRPFLLDARQSRALPIELQAILYNCLDPRPQHRYASAAALAHDLRAAAGQGTVAGRRPSVLARFGRDRSKVIRAAVVATCALAMLTAWCWPRGRDVQFVANCEVTKARVLLDGVREVWLGDRVWVPLGTHTARLSGDEVAPAEVEFEVTAGKGVKWVTMRTLNQREAGAAYFSPGRASLQWQTGHSVQEMLPGLARDRRYLDGGPELADPCFLQGGVAPGTHELRAVDGFGREERQTLHFGIAPEDVQMLPAVMARIEGEYRRTWSTVCSPRPEDLEVSGDYETWMGPGSDSPLGGLGVQQAACALTSPAAGVLSKVCLVCRLPKPMHSAVVYLRGTAMPGAELVVKAGFEGETPRVWPVHSDGALRTMRGFRSEAGARSFVITAEMRSGSAPRSNLALVRFLEGAVFGGHWRDEPPCFALVADPGDRARVPMSQIVPLPASLPLFGKTVELQSDSLSEAEVILMLSPHTSAQGEGGLLVSSRKRGERSNLQRLTWPGLLPARTWPAAILHERTDAKDGDGFAQDTMVADDLDGDGWGELVVGDCSSQRLGPMVSGSVGMLETRSGHVRWSWPQKVTESKFGDDNAGEVVAAGDWNADGVQDCAVSAASAAASGVEHVGYVEVVDGLTGAVLWSKAGEQPNGHFRAIDSWSDDLHRGPAALLFDQQWRLPTDRLDSMGVTAWLGGVGGYMPPFLRTPGASAAVLVGTKVPDGSPAIVLMRAGIWGDGFTGAERFECRDGRWQLTHRQPLALVVQDSLPESERWGRIAVRIGDQDGDGVEDVAFASRRLTTPTGVVFVSGADLRLLGFAPVPGLIECATWMPRVGSTPAQLVLAARQEPAADGRLRLFTIVPR